MEPTATTATFHQAPLRAHPRVAQTFDDSGIRAAPPRAHERGLGGRAPSELGPPEPAARLERLDRDTAAAPAPPRAAHERPARTEKTEPRERIALSGPAGDADSALQRALEDHTNQMMVAAGLFLLGGALLAATVQLAWSFTAIAFALVAAAMVLQVQARQKLRSALIQRAVACGASRADAKAQVDARLKDLMP